MFTKFDALARRAVVSALGNARRDGAAEIGTEHLLHALFDDPEVVRLTGLDDAGTQQVEARIAQARRAAGLSPVDADALAALGINLDDVLERVEGELGAGALSDQSRGRRRLRTPMTDGCRAALGSAARHAAVRRDPVLRADHLLLGLLSGRGLVADVLGDAGVTVATVLTALDSGEQRAS